jgi:transcription termination factor NusB
MTRASQTDLFSLKKFNNERSRREEELLRVSLTTLNYLDSMIKWIDERQAKLEFKISYKLQKNTLTALHKPVG